MHARPVFAPGDFRKATASQPERDCVEVARRAGAVEIRDDKVAFGGTDDHRVRLTDAEFDAFQAAVRDGAPAGGPLRLAEVDADTFVLSAASSSALLTFTRAEVDAFLDGVHRHEFDAPAFA